MSDTSELNDKQRPSLPAELGRFPDRLKQAIGEQSIRAFATECDISDTVLRQYLSGKSEPTRLILLRIAQLAHVSLDWLVSGYGQMHYYRSRAEAMEGLRGRIKSMSGTIAQRLVMDSESGLTEDNVRAFLRGEYEPSNAQLQEMSRRSQFISVTPFFGSKVPIVQEVPEQYRRRTDDGYVYIPLFHTGNNGEAAQFVDFLSFKMEWIRQQLHTMPQDLSLVFIEDNSMEPTLRPGDAILVIRRDADKIPRDGIYVLRMSGTLLVKRLQRLPGNQLRVTSDNPVYEPFTIPLNQPMEDFEIVGRVVWSGRRM